MQPLTVYIASVSTLSMLCGQQSFIIRKSSQFRDNLKRTKSATKLDRKKPDIVVSNGSATTDDRCVTYLFLDTSSPPVDTVYLVIIVQKIERKFCAIFCTAVVHSWMHTHTHTHVSAVITRVLRPAGSDLTLGFLSVFLCFFIH